jgi:hypothetical protein
VAHLHSDLKLKRRTRVSLAELVLGGSISFKGRKEVRQVVAGGAQAKSRAGAQRHKFGSSSLSVVR